MCLCICLCVFVCKRVCLLCFQDVLFDQVWYALRRTIQEKKVRLVVCDTREVVRLLTTSSVVKVVLLLVHVSINVEIQDVISKEDSTLDLVPPTLPGGPSRPRSLLPAGSGRLSPPSRPTAFGRPPDPFPWVNTHLPSEPGLQGSLEMMN